MNIVHLIYHGKDRIAHAKDYEFSELSMMAHWKSGLLDTKRTLRHKNWLQPPPDHVGVVTHDLRYDSDD
jgi:NTE family protein